MNTLVQLNRKPDFPLKVTELALEQVIAFKKADIDLGPDHKVRITCSAGGCAGYKHSLEFDDILDEDDIISNFILNDANIDFVIDPRSAELMSGVTLDYTITKWAEGFKFEGGDNLEKSCACGSSSSYCA